MTFAGIQCQSSQYPSPPTTKWLTGSLFNHLHPPLPNHHNPIRGMTSPEERREKNVERNLCCQRLIIELSSIDLLYERQVQKVKHISMRSIYSVIESVQAKSFLTKFPLALPHAEGIWSLEPFFRTKIDCTSSPNRSCPRSSCSSSPPFSQGKFNGQS